MGAEVAGSYLAVVTTGFDIPAFLLFSTLSASETVKDKDGTIL